MRLCPEKDLSVELLLLDLLRSQNGIYSSKTPVTYFKGIKQ